MMAPMAGLRTIYVLIKVLNAGDERVWATANAAKTDYKLGTAHEGPTQLGFFQLNLLVLEPEPTRDANHEAELSTFISQ